VSREHTVSWSRSNLVPATCIFLVWLGVPLGCVPPEEGEGEEWTLCTPEDAALVGEVEAQATLKIDDVNITCEAVAGWDDEGALLVMVSEDNDYAELMALTDWVLADFGDVELQPNCDEKTEVSLTPPDGSGSDPVDVRFGVTADGVCGAGVRPSG